jgi:hypothetical protein
MDTTLARRLMASLLALALLVAPVAGAYAADPIGETDSEASGPTPLRLGFMAGEVRFWRPGTESWVPAQVNIPLAAGDHLVTDHLGNIEVQTGPDSFLRVWGDSRLTLASHDDNGLRLGVSHGYLGLDLRSVEPGQRVHVDTPHAAVTIAQAGYYRIDVSADRTAVTARRDGRATVTAQGHTVSLAADHQVVAGGTPAPALEPATAPAADAWDRWSTERTDTLLAAESTRYVAPQVYGAADLDRHGTWREEPTYGPVWEPRGVPAGWVPYSTGTWIADPGYGWTWVDTAPWGWAPYHHGRWVLVNGVWAWAPGPRVARAVYAPALVAFFGAPRPVRRPYVSWVALGWGEPLVPWWGRPGFIGRPWYAGWSGPRHWHRDHFHGRPFDYRNVGVRNAVVGMHRDRFGRERVERARVPNVDVSRLQPVREPRPVVRDPGGARGARPPGDDTPRERPRERAATLPRPPGAPGAEPPSLRPDTPRDRDVPSARPTEPETREERQERRGGVMPPPPDDDARPAPRTSPRPSRSRPEQHWRRMGDVTPTPSVPRSPDRIGGERRDREAPANARGSAQPRGRR